jgi:hypothetical protein
MCCTDHRNPDDCVYPVKLKPGLRPGTGTDMIKRLEQLEERVQHQEGRLREQEIRLNQMNLMPPPVQMQPPIQMYQSMELPTIDMPTTIDMSSFGTNASPSGISNASFRDPLVLPPDDIVRDLINLFYIHIHPWAPILSPNPLQFTAPWNIIVHAIVVVTLRLSTDPRLINKQQYRAAAKQHVLSHAIESTSIASIQALALLALDLIGSEQGPSSWGILALLTRSAVHLGLVVEEETSYSGRAPAPSLSRMSIIPPAANWQEDESRRRLFWLIFALDRYACVSTGWDFALPDFEIKRRLPCSDERWRRNVRFLL